MLSAIKDLFTIYRNTNSSNIDRGKDLSNHLFTNEDKDWVCRGLSGELEHDNDWKNTEIDSKDKRAKTKFASLFNIPYRTIMNWLKNYSQGKKNCDSSGGKPPYLPKFELDKIYNNILNNNKPSERPTNENYKLDK
mmetsp:Transcript_17188/g.15515  ORF Transcript_17188/g.15515 Transcript_17188/m.15515 type:complete len:136 (+) Transcript_17188:133-540(+)